MDGFICKEKFIHEDQIRRVKEICSAVSIDSMMEELKSLSDRKRLQILLALYLEESLCVCDFAELLQCSMAAASHHLCYLADRHLVSRSQDGKFVYYSLGDRKTKDILKLLIEKETPVFANRKNKIRNRNFCVHQHRLSAHSGNPVFPKEKSSTLRKNTGWAIPGFIPSDPRQSHCGIRNPPDSSRLDRRLSGVSAAVPRYQSGSPSGK